MARASPSAVCLFSAHSPVAVLYIAVDMTPGDRVAYKVIPMVGPDRNHLAQDDTHASDWSEEIDLTPEQSPHIGPYFNRGIVAAQWVSRRLNITDQNFKPAARQEAHRGPDRRVHRETNGDNAILRPSRQIR
jgi:hypothetical protein